MQSRGSVCCALLVALSVSLRVVSSVVVTVQDNDDVILVVGEEGHEFEKFCTVTDSESVEEVQWLRDDIVVSSGLLVGNVANFLINEMDISASSAGDYYCRVVLTDGMVTDRVSAGNLMVLDPSVINAPPIQYALFNTSITLHCSIDYPGISAIATWSHGSNVFPAVMWSDEGSYECRLSAATLEPINRNVELKITVPPKLTSTPETLHEFTGDNFNRTISLQFTGRAGDTSTVTWLRDGDLLQSSPTAAGYMITTGYSGNTEGSTSLVFTEDFLSRSLEGRYTVTVENNNDVIPEQDRRENFSFQVTVTVPPAAITYVNVSTVLLQSVNIIWEANYRHADEDPDYILVIVETNNRMEKAEYRLEEREEWEEMSYKVGVVPGTQYWISLQSVNEDGDIVTEPFFFESQPSPPSVERTTVLRLNKTAFSITTNLDYTGGGIVTHFLVSFRENGASEWSSDKNVPATLVPDSDNLGWTGVIKSDDFAVFSEFEFRVQVANERDMTTSAFMQTEEQNLPDPPLRIEAVSTTKTTAVLEVQLSATGTPPLVVFVDLTSHPELSCCSNKTTYVGGDTVRFNLEGLSEGTTYTVNVYAENLVGKGSGDQIFFTTDGGSMLLPLWQIVLIGVCGALVLGVLTVLFGALLCCGCKASKKWGRREYYTGPIDSPSKDLDSGNPMLTRSIRSNGYASSQVSYGSHGGPGTSRSQSITSPGNNYIDSSRPVYDDIQNRVSSSVSPFHTNSKNRMENVSTSDVDPYIPPYYSQPYLEEQGYPSLARGSHMGGTQESVFSYASTTSPNATLSPPPAPKSCATDV